MAIEEITLTAVESGLDNEPEEELGRYSAERSELAFARRYRQLLQERGRFVWTQRARRRREEKFGVSCRGLVKRLTQKCAEPVVNHDSRQQVRTAIYVSVAGLLDEASRDIRRRQERSMTFFRYGLALAVFGLFSLVFAGLSGISGL